MTMMRPSAILSAVVGAAVCAAGIGLSSAAAGEIQAKQVASNLDNPTGLAVQPETGHVFIASHAGVVRFVPQSGKVVPQVKGYPKPTDIYGKGPKYPIGPLGLDFLDKNHLVVGDGSRPDSEELVRVYEVGARAPRQPIAEGKAKYTLGPIEPSGATAKGEGNFYGVAANGSAIFVTCNGDDTKGWVAKAPVQNGKPGKLELTIATKVATNVDAPVPITYSPDGDTLVIGQMGEINLPGDSLLTFYNPQTGKLKQTLKTGLNDIAGLAYSPKTGKLYATDFSWLDPSRGALYELQVNGNQVKAVKVLDLDKPTALDFDSQGNLYIAVFGTPEEGSDEPSGALLRVGPGL